MVSDKQVELLLLVVGVLLIAAFATVATNIKDFQSQLVAKHLPEYLCTPYFKSNLLNNYNNATCEKWIAIAEQPTDLMCSPFKGANETICKTLMGVVDQKAQRCRATGPTPDVPTGPNEITRLCKEWLGSDELMTINLTVV